MPKKITITFNVPKWLLISLPTVLALFLIISFLFVKSRLIDERQPMFYCQTNATVYMEDAQAIISQYKKHGIKATVAYGNSKYGTIASIDVKNIDLNRAKKVQIDYDEALWKEMSSWSRVKLFY